MSGFSGNVSFVRSGHALSRLIDAQIFAGRLPGIIVLDIQLAGKNGMLVLKGLREDHRLNDVTIIILAAEKDEGVMRQCYQFGASRYMVKPTVFDSLVKIAGYIMAFMPDGDEPPTSWM